MIMISKVCPYTREPNCALCMPQDLIEVGGDVQTVLKPKAPRESYLEKIRRLLWIGKRQKPDEMFAQWI